MGFGLRPNNAVPTRMMVAPSSTATSKSFDMPIDSCFRPYFSANSAKRRKYGRESSAFSDHGGTVMSPVIRVLAHLAAASSSLGTSSGLAPVLFGSSESLISRPLSFSPTPLQNGPIVQSIWRSQWFGSTQTTLPPAALYWTADVRSGDNGLHPTRRVEALCPRIPGHNFHRTPAAPPGTLPESRPQKTSWSPPLGLGENARARYVSKPRQFALPPRSDV